MRTGNGPDYLGNGVTSRPDSLGLGGDGSETPTRGRNASDASHIAYFNYVLAKELAAQTGLSHEYVLLWASLCKHEREKAYAAADETLRLLLDRLNEEFPPKERRSRVRRIAPREMKWDIRTGIDRRIAE